MSGIVGSPWRGIRSLPLPGARMSPVSRPMANELGCSQIPPDADIHGMSAVVLDDGRVLVAWHEGGVNGGTHFAGLRSGKAVLAGLAPSVGALEQPGAVDLSTVAVLYRHETADQNVSPATVGVDGCLSYDWRGGFRLNFTAARNSTNPDIPQPNNAYGGYMYSPDGLSWPTVSWPGAVGGPFVQIANTFQITDRTQLCFRSTPCNGPANAYMGPGERGNFLGVGVFGAINSDPLLGQERYDNISYHPNGPSYVDWTDTYYWRYNPYKRSYMVVAAESGGGLQLVDRIKRGETQRGGWMTPNDFIITGLHPDSQWNTAVVHSGLRYFALLDLRDGPVHFGADFPYDEPDFWRPGGFSNILSLGRWFNERKRHLLATDGGGGGGSIYYRNTPFLVNIAKAACRLAAVQFGGEPNGDLLAVYGHEIAVLKQPRFEVGMDIKTGNNSYRKHRINATIHGVKASPDPLWVDHGFNNPYVHFGNRPPGFDINNDPGPRP